VTVQVKWKGYEKFALATISRFISERSHAVIVTMEDE